MNEQIHNLFLNGTPIEYMDIVIYDSRIGGITTLEDAAAKAREVLEQMLAEGYEIVKDANGRDYVKAKDQLPRMRGYATQPNH